MKVLIAGGSKSGKTACALRLAMKLSENKKRYYTAAMIPCDDEDRARIDRHIAEREGMGFVTLEVGRDISSCMQTENGVYLIDSVTALLTNEMFSENGVDAQAKSRCLKGLKAVAERAESAIFVTDLIFSDAELYDPVTEDFRASLASLNRALAAECDTVIEMGCGNIICHKGAVPE